MNKIKSFFRHITHRISTMKLTTPAAVIVGAIIIAAGIVSYGYIVRPVGLAEAASADLVKEVAKELKLKGSKWEACLASPDTAKQVQKELNDGVAAGVTGTPTTFVLVKKNGVYETAAKIEGAQGEGAVRAAINQALSGTVKTTPFAGSQVSDTEFVNGAKNNVMVVEYADAQCPFCVRFHPTITNVMSEYNDRVGFVYRHFPLTQIHPNAVPYAVAIECAGNLKGEGAYFGFIDKLFAKEAGN